MNKIVYLDTFKFLLKIYSFNYNKNYFKFLLKIYSFNYNKNY